MTNYVWYPVSGDGQTQATGYTWNPAPANWNTGSWAVADALIFGGVVVPGAIPGSGTGNSSGPGLDNVGVVAGNVNAFLFGLLYTPNPSKGNPFVNSTDYPVNLTINTGTVNINSLLLGGFNTIASTIRFPTIDVEGATFKLNGSIANSDTVIFGTSNTYAATGGGTIDIGTGGTVQVAGTVQSSITMLFKDGANDFLNLGAVSAATPSAFAGTIAGFATGDTIVLTSAPYALGESALYAGGTVTVSNGVATLASLPVSGVYTPTSFQVANVGGKAALVLCFLPGTQIRTPEGDRSVEALAAGDTVVTAGGAHRAVTWIGTGSVLATRGRRGPATPVIVRRGALADNVPDRDLRVTKGHSLFLDGVLIPVEFLVNHRTIRWDDHAQEVTVYHVELETHDVLLANGAPAESYRDDGNRWLFRNANPGWDRPAPPPCAPVLTGGPVVDAVWRRLLDRAGPRLGGPVTQDAGPRLSADGRDWTPVSRTETLVVFRLPAPRSGVRLLSRAAAPQELGLARDPRVLGLPVRQIRVGQGARLRIAEAMDSDLADGFHGHEETEGLRWTTGDAALPARLFDGLSGIVVVEVHLGGATLYVEDDLAAA